MNEKKQSLSCKVTKLLFKNILIEKTSLLFFFTYNTY